MRESVEDGEKGVAAAVRLAEGARLRSVVAADDPVGWVSLDAGVREVSWSYPTRTVPRPAWEHAAPLPADLTQLGESGLALALCHRDGRTRETAIRRAGPYPGLLPLIVIRCSDWAAPVRERARKLLREALDPPAAVALAPLILLVGRRDRGGFGVELLGDTLRRAPLAEFAALLVHRDRVTRRFAYRLAAEHDRLSPAELARAAADDPDFVIQDLCATAALTRLREADAAPADVLEPLLTARPPHVRSAGVTALRRAGQPERAEAFLGDRSGRVRACARYVVRQHGGDPVAWYRERCATPDDPGLVPGAVIGLAECGDRADGALLRPLLAHPADGVRGQAVAGLRALDLADSRQLRPLLDDPAPGVVRQTTLALLPSARQLPADWLLERAGPRLPRHIRVAAFRLLHAHGGVAVLRAAVGLLDDPDVKLRTWAAQSVQRWHPSADVRRGDPEVGVLLDRCGHLFSEHVLKRRKWAAGLDA
ncbi:hypothetical protein GCM10010277_37030 [Streptomyces longisporoflavus]|uniref:hypothetical protein n=1 Tax=Streptomyces longisporoflavus TaxID=28044 RepID=UPI0019B643C8|nr:hypothetical protein [Streptomyces longisporoflavus]GGV45806.1 hypothetical protein GCM10010277_37030 [Streptomyces longisporoflavus]